MIDTIRKWAHDNDKRIHQRGLIVFAPPGSGKSYFVGQHPQDWVDTDPIFSDVSLHSSDWHNDTHDETEEAEHYTQCDIGLKIMRELGLWVVGSLFWDFVPDAIVLLRKDTHREYVLQRDDLNWNDVCVVRKFLQTLAKTHSLPVYDSFDEMVLFETAKIKI